MKTFRVLGAVFFVFGFFFTLLGIVSIVLPLLENEHLKVILESFQVASTDPLTNTLNTLVLFCLKSSYFLLFCGISLMVAGGLINTSVHKRLETEAVEELTYASQSDWPYAAQAQGEPKPAYYPGGLEPTPDTDTSVGGIRIMQTNDNESPAFGLSAQTGGAIAGKIEPSFSGDDDAQRLMRYDQEIKAYRNPEKKAEEIQPDVPETDYEQYISNSAPEEQAEEPAAGAPVPSEPPHSVDTVRPQKPKIVSTMGKRRF